MSLKDQIGKEMIQFQNSSDESIIFMCKGVLTFQLITSIIASVEQVINSFEEDRRVQKKLYSVLSESIQNAFYHRENTEMVSVDLDGSSVLILITANAQFYSIKTCNQIANWKVARLKDRIDKINELTPEDLRNLYRKVLAESHFSSKNTAGLGLMDMARKSGHKLRYDFERISDDFSNFNIEIKLSRGYGYGGHLSISSVEAKLNLA